MRSALGCHARSRCAIWDVAPPDDEEAGSAKRERRARGWRRRTAQSAAFSRPREAAAQPLRYGRPRVRHVRRALPPCGSQAPSGRRLWCRRLQEFLQARAEGGDTCDEPGTPGVRLHRPGALRPASPPRCGRRSPPRERRSPSPRRARDGAVASRHDPAAGHWKKYQRHPMYTSVWCYSRKSRPG